MNRTIITADSTFDLPQEWVRKNDIKVFPSYVRMGEACYDDYPDLKQQALFDFYDHTGELPTTAAANPSDYTRFFEQYAGKCDALIHIAKSSGISSCYENAVAAAAPFGNVFVVDSKSVSGGSAVLAMRAAERAEEMETGELVEFLCRYRDRVDGSFIVERLEYLYKGGRCSSLSYYGANVLMLKPCIAIQNGKMVAGKKYRGSYRRCLRDYVDGRFARPDEFGHDELFVAHSLLDDAVLNEVLAYIRSKVEFGRIIVSPAGAAVACHCGPNTFGMFTIRNEVR